MYFMISLGGLFAILVCICCDARIVVAIFNANGEVELNYHQLPDRVKLA